MSTIKLFKTEHEIRMHYASYKEEIPKPSYDIAGWLSYTIERADDRLLFFRYNASETISESNAEDIFSREVIKLCNNMLSNGWLLYIDITSNENIYYRIYTTAPGQIYVDIFVAFLTDEIVNLMNETAFDLSTDIKKSSRVERPLRISEDLYIYREVCFMP